MKTKSNEGPSCGAVEYREMLQPFTTSVEVGSGKRYESDYYVEGYATTFDKPYVLHEWDGVKHYEKIDRNALDGADMSDVIMQYDHMGKVLARCTNNTLGIEADTKGLFCYADLSKSRAAKDLHEEIRNGLITKMSWAFRVSEDEFDRETHTRTIKKIAKVYDVSAVAYPANGATGISARSQCGITRDDELLRRAQLLKIKIMLEVTQ